MQQRYSEGYLSYRGRSPCLSKRKEKSAEVIVVGGNEPLERTEVSFSKRMARRSVLSWKMGWKNTFFIQLNNTLFPFGKCFIQQEKWEKSPG